MTTNIQGLKELGHEAVGFNFAPKVFQSQENVYALATKGNFAVKAALNCAFFAKFLYHLATATHVHWVYGSKSKVASVLMKVVKLFGKKRLVEFCGSDVRSLEKMCADIPFFEPDYFDQTQQRQLGTQITSDATQRKFADHGFQAIFNSIELEDYANSSIFPCYHTYNRSVVLKDILEQAKEAKTGNRLPMIVHIPSNPKIKGTDYFIEAAKKLKEQGLADYEMITGVTRPEALAKIKNADIVVDQLVIGEYGVLSIEAMALKKPVICFIRPKLLKRYQDEFEGFPIVSADKNSIHDKMLELVEMDQDKRDELGEKGSDFVKRYHAHDVNAKLLESIYSSL